MVLLAYLVACIAGQWLNMNPTYRIYSACDLFLSVVMMAPITVCALVTCRYCAIFSTVSRILDSMNRGLSREVSLFQCQQASANISAYKLTNNELKLSDHLEQLIIQYDKLYDVVAAIIEIYSPSILLLMALDFSQVTFELYLFYCYLSRASPSEDDFRMMIFSLCTAFLSIGEIYFVVEGTSRFSEKVLDATDEIHRIGVVCSDKRLAESIFHLYEILHRMHEKAIMYYCFALNKSFLTKIIAASCSYLILMMQTN
ncbi:uncharacterized protein LOC134224904 [Armigeres subalbatus]|uniref:uncharacterized protein LOC134224904 n=1 Tax=Armigeres subalbatus TaxID=124917 RepID=UPI002ED61841